MLSRQKQAVQVFRRVRDFLKEGAPEVSYGSVAGVVAQLDDVIARLETFAREQDARSRQMSAATRVNRAQVAAVRREYMRPIASAARALFPTDPQLLVALSMPPVRDYVGVITAAEAMAQAAAPHAEKFTAIGLPADFVARMQKAAAELRAQLDVRSAELGRRAASTAGLRREYSRGRDVVRMLDAMVAPRLVATPARAAEWRVIARFARLPVQGKPGETSEPTVPTPPTTGSPGTSVPAIQEAKAA